jgi:hypothetical protein
MNTYTNTVPHNTVVAVVKNKLCCSGHPHVTPHPCQDLASLPNTVFNTATTQKDKDPKQHC